MSNERRVPFRETQPAEIGGERRAKRRYPMRLPLQFKIVKNYVVIGTGYGTSLDLSSNGIAFATSSPLRVGSHVELAIGWPVPLNGSCALKLVASGRVVRSDQNCTAIAMERHEFRTQGAKAMQAETLTVQ